MPDMTEEEAFALDELYTKTTPKVRKGEGGFFTERKARMLLLDEATVHIIDARSKALRQTPAEFVSQLIRKEMVAAVPV
ncbi:MAG: hypothetical protein FWD40_12040 [Treponema sp.]|nr:hypothetical protein [Treponema sp.]